MDASATEECHPCTGNAVLARRRSGFAGDVIKLVSGAVFAQSLVALSSPVLTRLYGPTSFGVLALFASLTGAVGTILCLRYDAAIVLPDSDGEAADLLVASLAIASLVSLAAVPLVWLGGPWIARLLNAPGLAPCLWLVPPVLFFGGISTGHPALNYWAARTRRFERLSVTRVISAILGTAGQFGLAFAGHAEGGSLIAAGSLGSVVSTAWLALGSWRDDGVLVRRSVTWRGIAQGLRRYQKFPLYSTWSAVFNSISWQLPTFMLAAFFSPAVAGYYALGTRVLRSPMDVLGSSIGQVFFQRAARARAEGTLADVVESVFARLVTYGLFPMLTLTLVGRHAFVLFFGEAWSEAGVYAQILGLWMFFWFVSSPLVNLVSVLEKNEFGLQFNIILLVTRLASLWVGGALGDARLALLLFAASGLLAYGYLDLTVITASGVRLARTGAILLTGLLRFAPAGLVMGALVLFGAPAVVSVSVAALLLIGYYVWVLSRDREACAVLSQVSFLRRFVRRVEGGR